MWLKKKLLNGLSRNLFGSMPCSHRCNLKMWWSNPSVFAVYHIQREFFRARSGCFIGLLKNFVQKSYYIGNIFELVSQTCNWDARPDHLFYGWSKPDCFTIHFIFSILFHSNYIPWWPLWNECTWSPRKSSWYFYFQQAGSKLFWHGISPFLPKYTVHKASCPCKSTAFVIFLLDG